MAYRCDFCPSTFTRKHNLKGHLNSHLGLKPFHCSNCSTRFTRKHDLHVHMREKHDASAPKFVCNAIIDPVLALKCGHEFSRKQSLQRHMQSHAKHLVEDNVPEQSDDSLTTPGSSFLTDEETLSAVPSMYRKDSDFDAFQGLDFPADEIIASQTHTELAMIDKFDLFSTQNVENAWVAEPQPLIVAMKQDALSIFSAWLSTSIDINERDVQLFGPIHLAACNARYASYLALLIQKNAMVDLAGGQAAMTALQIAASFGNLPGVELLVAAGASLNALDIKLNSCLDFACGSPWISHDETHFKNYGFSQAVEPEACLKIAERLLHLGADVNHNTLVLKSPLHYAASYRSSPELITLLVQSGAHVNERSGSGATPLHLALSIGTIDCAKALLDLGADVLALDGDGKSPLLSLRFDSDGEDFGQVLDLLVKAGADVKAIDKEGNSLLHNAVGSILTVEPETVKLLLEYGLSPYHRNRAGESPYSLCVDNMRLDLDNIGFAFNTGANGLHKSSLRCARSSLAVLKLFSESDPPQVNGPFGYPIFPDGI